MNKNKIKTLFYKIDFIYLYIEFIELYDPSTNGIHRGG